MKNGLNFTTLASVESVQRNGSVVAAAEELSIARTSVHQHLAVLEDHFNMRLFDVNKRRYTVRPEAVHIVLHASEIVAQFNSFASRSPAESHNSTHVKLTHQYDSLKGDLFACELHPIADIFSDNISPFPRLITDIVHGNGLDNSELLAKYNPFITSYVRANQEWLCTHQGREAAYFKFFPSEQLQETKYSVDDEAGREFDGFSRIPYLPTFMTGGIRYDHNYIRTKLPNSNRVIHLRYARVIYVTKVSKGVLKLNSLPILTNDIRGQSLPLTEHTRMDKSLEMDIRI